MGPPPGPPPFPSSLAASFPLCSAARCGRGGRVPSHALIPVRYRWLGTLQPYPYKTTLRGSRGHGPIRLPQLRYTSRITTIKGPL